MVGSVIPFVKDEDEWEALLVRKTSLCLTASKTKMLKFSVFPCPLPPPTPLFPLSTSRLLVSDICPFKLNTTRQLLSWGFVVHYLVSRPSPVLERVRTRLNHRFVANWHKLYMLVSHGTRFIR